MPGLPNAHRAVVDREKVIDYLLSMEHPSGRHKARVFQAWGFSLEDFQAFADALRYTAVVGDLELRSTLPHGLLYRVTGVIQTPVAGPREIRTLWLLENSGSVPRLVTAYPGRRR